MKLNNCVHCGADLENRIINWVEYVNGHKLEVPDVPAMVCPKCGEQYIHEKVLKQIEDEREKLQAKKEELEVRLKEIRSLKGLTQEEVAKRMGFTVSRYSDIENNRKKPNILLALRLAKVLQCSVDEIYKIKG